MYQIICDNDILYDLRAERYVINPKLNLELNKSGKLSFSIPSSNKCNIKKLNGVFEVFRDGIKIFEGRCLNDNKDFYNSKKIQVLGALDYFNDSIIRPFELHNIGVKDFLTYIINNHNNQVDDFKKFKLGKVDVVDFDGGETLYRKSEEYKSSWDIIYDRLIKRLGGYLSVKYVGNDKYIDYTQCSGENSLQVIEFGKNLLDLTEYTKAEDVKTCIIPIGKDNLTIKTVNNGNDYIYDENAVNLYGYIWEVVKFENVTVASNLLKKARNYLESCVNLASTIELNAIDLSIIDKNIESFKLGEYALVISKPHNLSKYMQISNMSICLDNQSSSKIVLGNTIEGLTDNQISIKKQANNINAVQSNVNVINKELYLTNTKFEKQRKYSIMGV